IWALGIFFGYVGGIGKNFKSTPPSIAAQSAQIKEQQRQATENARLKQQELMDAMKRRISDGTRKF
ncbi:MAG: hypothetical protein HY591_04470, partial [Candidatus Omnitrophica bacterium]|nr:hypothetical protein [Candidatus Omnitrophota bacterium]